ncbi:Phospholipid phosphatase 5 [Porphyridium purpureum]|uniref:Phospholipid phosphatase 5 n=1 Tax=Porphyridium purpureum TaxID=35688 RepID=A0A5J4Z727_PORPP|nr:Phospholipid phosphatase 5 [Porphyridium purpureum]|eukprot:POR3696..scf295_1
MARSTPEEYTIRSVRWRPLLRQLPWGSFFAAVVAFGLGSLGMTFIEPRQIIWVLDDPRLAYPMKENTIANWLAVVGVFFFFILYVPVVEIVMLRRENRCMTIIIFQIFVFASTFVECFLSTVFFQQFTSVLTGMLRPDWYARCQPAEMNGTLLCTSADTDTIKDGRKSFFSGHASSSAVSMAILSMYLVYAWYFRKAQKRGAGPTEAYSSSRDYSQRKESRAHWLFHELTDALMFLLTAMPAFWLIGVGLSRVVDYRHAREDVVGGWFIGLFFAVVEFPRYVALSKDGATNLEHILGISRANGVLSPKTDSTDVEMGMPNGEGSPSALAQVEVEEQTSFVTAPDYEAAAAV